VLPDVLAGTRRVVVARSNDRVVAIVQIDTGLPPNQVAPKWPGCSCLAPRGAGGSCERR
jgi:hypothetical protein